MRRLRRVPAIPLFVIALVCGGLLGDRALAAAVSNETRDSLRLFTELVSVEHERYGSDVRYEDLLESAIAGMLHTLDPHTSFLPPSAYDGMRGKQQSSFYGIGVLIGIRNEQLTVISPLEGGPASRLGILAGDVIDTVEGEPTEAMSIDDAIDKLKGPKGTDVKITIVRRGLDAPLAFSVTRAEIPQTTVRQAYMMTPDTGYILLISFARGTGREMSDAIAKLKAQGMKQLLLDLRNNGGGLLDQAIDVADQFLPRDLAIVETRGRTRDSGQTFRTAGQHPDLGVPVVVLVNEGTASASEIVSGAIQDHDGGLVAGEPTWGKGLVQSVLNLSYGSGLALTTAKYYTPSGRLIQRDYTSYFDYYMHKDAGKPADLTKAQVFHTDLGREVYGGGGITPDVVLNDEPLPAFESFLLARNAYFNFAVDFERRNHVKDPDWKPDAAVLGEFKRWLVSEKLATEAEIATGFAQKDVPGAYEVLRGGNLIAYLGFAVTLRSWVDKNEATTEKFLAATSEADQWMRKNPKQAAGIATRWIPGLKLDVAETAMQFNIQQLDRRLSANNYRALWSAQDRLHRLGIIKSVFDVNKHIEPKPILNVMKKNPELFADLPPIPADVAITPGFVFKP